MEQLEFNLHNGKTNERSDMSNFNSAEGLNDTKQVLFQQIII